MSSVRVGSHTVAQVIITLDFTGSVAPAAGPTEHTAGVWHKYVSYKSMQAETWIGVGASICTGIAMLPQLVKIYKEKKPTEVSFLTIAVLMAGLLLWVWYCTKKTDWIIMISNTVSFLLNIGIVLLNLLYRRR